MTHTAPVYEYQQLTRERQSLMNSHQQSWWFNL
jgi:hypothetical protein